MSQKVKVIEVEATKLDPNAVYLVVFDERDLSREQMRFVAQELDKFGVKAAYTMAHDPETALKVYQIPKEQA